MKSRPEGQFVTCPYCGESFWTTRRNKRFCSETHRKLHHKQHGRTSYDQDIDEPVYSITVSGEPVDVEDEKEQPTERDVSEPRPIGRKCEVCGYQRSTFGPQMRVSRHHIIPRRLGGKADPENLVDLCDACHDWAELFAWQAKSRQDFFKFVHLNYPWPDSMTKPQYDPDKVGCRLHGNWRLWVYGGQVPPEWKCTCKKRGSAKVAESDIPPRSSGSDSAQGVAVGGPGKTE